MKKNQDNTSTSSNLDNLILKAKEKDKNTTHNQCDINSNEPCDSCGS